MSILTKIRQRPDHQKKIFSLVSAGVLTLIILTVWLSFTGLKKDLSTDMVVNDQTLSSISPAQVIKEEFSKAMSNFKEITSTTTATTTN